jgi:phosphatidylserine synthase
MFYPSPRPLVRRFLLVSLVVFGGAGLAWLAFFFASERVALSVVLLAMFMDGWIARKVMHEEDR